MTTSELAWKIRMKLMETEKAYGKKTSSSKSSIQMPSSMVKTKELTSQQLNPFNSKRKREEMEGESKESYKFIFKHREGYINAVKRPVLFEFFS